MSRLPIDVCERCGIRSPVTHIDGRVECPDHHNHLTLAWEIEQLRDALQEAYIEGFLDGQDHGNLSCKYPPLVIAFLKSETRTSLGPVPSEHHKMVQAWHTAKIVDRDTMKLPAIEDVKVTS